MSEVFSHITSLVVLSRPEESSLVLDALQEIPAAEVMRSDVPGRFVVCLESQSLGETTAMIESIRNTHGVQDASLVFHQQERADRLDETVSVTHSSVREATQ